MCALIKDNVEKPGDIDGVIYVTYDDRGAWKMEIAKEFKTLGLQFNPDAILRNIHGAICLFNTFAYGVRPSQMVWFVWLNFSGMNLDD